MANSFTRQLEPCSHTGRFAYPGPDVDLSGTAADIIPSRLKEVAFLKRFLADQGGAESLRLQERLTSADCQSKRILRALLWFGLLFVLSLVVLSYCAVLLPEPFPYRLHIGIKGVILLCLVSVFSAVELLGELVWQRIVMNRLHQECRRVIPSLLGPELKAPQTESANTAVGQEARVIPPPS